MNKRLDMLGHVGYALVGFGTLLIAYDISVGWLISLAGALLWTWIGWRMRASSIYIWEALVFAPITVLGWLRS